MTARFGKRTAPPPSRPCDDNQRYSTELACYRLLQERQILEINGYAVPQLIDFDAGLRVIEITIVAPPYVIDFGKAYLASAPPDFSPEVISEWLAEKEELYGDRWPEIRSVLARLRLIGIFHLDPKPHNILPLNWDPHAG